MDPGQAVPDAVGQVLTACQIQGVSPVTLLLITEGESRFFRNLEIADGQRRISGRRIQLVGSADIHAWAQEDPVPGADRHDLLQQRARLVPFPGIHERADQPKGRLRPVQGIFLRVEGLPGLPHVDRILPDIEGPGIGIGHGPADQALQVPVARNPGLLQRLLIGDDRLVILSPIVGDQSPVIPKPSFCGSIPF